MRCAGEYSGTSTMMLLMGEDDDDHGDGEDDDGGDDGEDTARIHCLLSCAAHSSHLIENIINFCSKNIPMFLFSTKTCQQSVSC